MLKKLIQPLTNTRKVSPWALLLGLGLVLSLPVSAADTKTAEASDDVVQNVGHNQVNWTSKVVWAVGSGAANLKDGNVAVARLNAELQNLTRFAIFLKRSKGFKSMAAKMQEI